MPLQVEDGLGETDEGAAPRASVDRKRQGRALRRRIAGREKRGNVLVGGQAFARLPQRCLIHLVHRFPRQPNRNRAPPPTLLGGVDLVRRWGRTGTVGSSLIQAFPDEPSAQAALDTLAERKRRRGYT